MKWIILAILVVLIAAAVIAYLVWRPKIRTETASGAPGRIEDVPKDAWNKLAGKKVFFGHKSVGNNIMAGVNDLVKEHDFISLNVVETKDALSFKEAAFAHAKIGTNTRPSTKIAAFKSLMETGPEGQPDIAFFKCCYVDMTRKDDPVALFDEYKAAMDELVAKHPDTIFLHFTIPISVPAGGFKQDLKATVKNATGKSGVFEDNRKREEYNRLMREAYGKTGRLFDLAKAESTRPDGSRTYLEKNGQRVYALAPEYTYDGGHLNEKGRRAVAEQLLIMLANIAAGE